MEDTNKPRLRNPSATALRDATTIQVNLDPNHSLLLSGDIGEIRKFLNALDGQHCVSELVTTFSFAKSALDKLTRRGLIETEHLDSDTTSKYTKSELDRFITSQRSHQAAATKIDFSKERLANLTKAYVAVLTSGPASALIAFLLAAQQIGRIKLFAQNDFKPSDLPFWISAYPETQMDLSQLLRSISSQISLNQPANNQKPNFAIIADQPWSSVERSLELMNQGIAHLVIDPKVSEVCVGPLVIPGYSSCLNCAEMSVASVDKSWPDMRQLLGQHQEDQTDWLLLQLAVSFAAAQMIQVISSGDALTSALLNRRWRFRLPGPTIEVQQMPVNMFCPCQWGALPK